MTLHPLTKTLLARRGLTDEKDIAHFLEPNWARDLGDPLLMKDAERAATRILAAIRGGERMVIYSDYDMDGIPGAVVLFDTLRALGATNIEHYTPHRTLDGFGLSVTAFEELKAHDARVVISVDCGSSDLEPARRAEELGIDLIITDHHLFPHTESGAEIVPPAYAVLNPKREGCLYPEKNLCGAGVAFVLARALLTLAQRDATPENAKKLPDETFLKWLLDMVGMATIADMVPLLGENRMLAHFGLVVLRKSPRPGLRALFRVARLKQPALAEEDVGFSIAPRINAASRMGHAQDAFRLLATRDEVEAETLARHLEKLNRERKGIVAAMVKEAHHTLKTREEIPSLIVIGNTLWRPSLAGLVANTLSETYARPAFVWGREAGMVIKGSCRAPRGESVVEIMSRAESIFIEYGGHHASGGFSIADEHIFFLEERLLGAHEKTRANMSSLKEESTTHEYDASLSLAEVNEKTYRAIAPLAPFGAGNQKPLFSFENVVPSEIRCFGKTNEHLEVIFQEGERKISAVAFFKTSDSFSKPLISGASVSLLANIERDLFKGGVLRLRIVDVY